MTPEEQAYAAAVAFAPSDPPSSRRLSWLRIGAARIPWLRHPVVLWIDNAGGRLLRPGRRLLEAVGLKRLTRPIDLSPMLSLTLLQLLHRLALVVVSGG